MKKIFSLLAALALTSMANAEIYEVGAEGNDNSIDISIDGVDEGDIVLNISLTNPTASIVGMDCYLDFSGGNENIIDDAVVSEERGKSGRSMTHSATTGIVKVEGEHLGQFYISVNSSKTAALKNTEGVVATLYISGEIAEGEYTIRMPYSICYNTVDKYICAEKEYTFTYANGVVTGINGISVDAQNAKYYSVNGAIQNGPQKGVNIVKYADGKVKKVIIK
jgi:hypothetical protein